MVCIFSKSGDPVFNLAAEEHLFFRDEASVLFLYVNTPSVIIGCNQAVRNEVNLAFCDSEGVKVVRRMSGGGAVYHDRGNLNFCFIYGREAGKSALGAEFLEPVVSVLSQLGVAAEVGRRKDLWLEGGYKITGTASHAGKTRELHHGTLLYDTDLERLETVLHALQVDPDVKAIASVRSRVKNIRTYLEEQGAVVVDSEVFFGRFAALLAGATGATEAVLDANDLEAIGRLQAEKYATREWTYKK